VTSSESLPLNRVTSSSDVRQATPAADELDDDVVTSSSRDGDDDDDDDAGEDEAESADDEGDEPMTSPSAADMKQQVDLGPEVSIFIYLKGCYELWLGRRVTQQQY